MLHKESHIVSAETFLLIQQLEALPELNDFSLTRKPTAFGGGYVLEAMPEL